jgi:cell wall-associated NlpC family hydrolase
MFVPEGQKEARGGRAAIPSAFFALLAVLFLVAVHWNDEGTQRQSVYQEAIATEENIQRDEMEPGPFRDWTSHEERIRFIKVVMAFEGTPYKAGGNTASGMDCSGLVYIAYRIFDVTLPRTVARQFCIGRKIRRDELEEGDLVFFNGFEKANHVGIYLGDGKFIHASSTAKKLRIDFLASPWQYKHFLGAVRIRELKEPKKGSRETR